MEQNGQLKVDDFLRVEGYTDIYAVGDCNNTKDTKVLATAYLAGAQSELVVNNLLKSAQGKNEVRWKQSKSVTANSQIIKTSSTPV